MKAFNDETIYSLRADANALGGFLEEPFARTIPALAPVSLPAVGGFATARSGAFNLDEIVSCSSAYTLVTGREESGSGGTISTLCTAVIEDLNILEVVTAKRIVAQIAVTIPKERSLPRRISFAGSRFEGLRLAGRDCTPRMNSELHRLDVGNGEELPLTWQSIANAGRLQADRLMTWYRSRNQDAKKWATERHGWMTSSDPARKEGASVLCSLVDGFQTGNHFENDPEKEPHNGHIVAIPGFGRIILGELLVSRESVQLVSIRAELGCPVVGRVTGPTPATSGGGGQGNRD